MPRKPRFFVDDMPVHVVQRGHCREPVFFEGKDYATYIYWLAQGCERYDIAIHSFCLMTNHVHLLLTPKEGGAVSRFVQFVGRHYVPYINTKYGKNGTLWDGRFKASLVDSEGYLVNVMRYIELNPVRAGIVDTPSAYRWSSFKHNTGQLSIALVQEHPVFTGLGATHAIAKTWYLKTFNQQLTEQAIKNITACWLTGTPLGSDKFKSKVERTLKRRVGVARKGPSGRVK